MANLVYASKSLCIKEKTSFESQTVSNYTASTIEQLPEDQLKTLTCLYELICHLCHSKFSGFLSQFCDAVAILKVEIIFHHVLSTSRKEAKRVKYLILALLNHILRDSPENADLIESILFQNTFDLAYLLEDSDDSCRYQAVVLLRSLGRYCCVSLKKRWSPKIKLQLKQLTRDFNLNIRLEALSISEEFKHISFV